MNVNAVLAAVITNDTRYRLKKNSRLVSHSFWRFHQPFLQAGQLEKTASGTVKMIDDDIGVNEKKTSGSAYNDCNKDHVDDENKNKTKKNVNNYVDD